MRFIYLFFIFLLVAFNSFAKEVVPLEWLKLLHYQNKSEQYVSLIENDEFFLNSNGRYNPEIEYETSIEEFNRKESDKKCVFPARFMLLKRLGKVDGNLSDCKDYQWFLNDVQPKDITMLFTNAYMNNPASLFGHTLFRIDTNRKGTQLLAHGANFGADTGDENGVLYALKGLWGGYYGTFGIKPYYDVINMYNNIENRDIWEYKLNLSDEELSLFVAHIWEMKNAKIRYYFASKNCSYVLLQMLDAINPELNLSNNFNNYTLPLETLKIVDKVPQFIKETNYRPSRQSKLKYRESLMNDSQLKSLANIVKRNKIGFDELSDEEKADVLETAYQYVQYSYVEGNMELQEYRKKSILLLRERSKIVNNRQYFDSLIKGENPVDSHDDKQISINFGSKNGNAFQEIRFRPIYTSLMDDSYGLLKGAEVRAFETKVRHYDNDDKYEMNEFTILKIKSLSERDLLFKPYSYEMSAAIKRIFDVKEDDDKTVFDGFFNAGASYKVLPNTMFYVMSGPNLIYGGAIEDDYTLGFDFKAGIYFNYEKWRLRLEAMQNFATNYLTKGQTYSFEIGYGINKNLTLNASTKIFENNYKNDEEFSLGLKYNF